MISAATSLLNTTILLWQCYNPLRICSATFHTGTASLKAVGRDLVPEVYLKMGMYEAKEMMTNVPRMENGALAICS